MKYRSLGATPLRLSEIGFGCGPTAGLMVKGSRGERRRAVARALEMGISYFDTAAIYGDGVSETHLGETLRDLGARPVVGTKVALRDQDLDDIPAAVFRSVEESLQRLGMESVDILHLHNRVAPHRVEGSNVGIGPLLSVEDVLGPNGVLESFERLREQGKVRFLGCCAFGGEVAAVGRVMDSGRFQSLLAYYNVLNPTAGRLPPPGFRGYDYGQVIDRAADCGMGVVALRVLAAGALGSRDTLHPLARGPSGAEYQANAERARALAFLAEGGQTLPQAAVRFALTNRQVSTALVGFSSLDQMEEAAPCSDAGALPEETLRQIEALYATDFGLAPPAT